MPRRLQFAVALLVLPVAALLFAQWPLRDLVQAGSRQANDLAQILFAIYMAAGVTAASRAGVHFAARPAGAVPRRWVPWAVLLCIAPWALFVLVHAAPQVWRSVLQAEHFSETFNPGYFLLRIAGWLLPALALADAVRAAWQAGRPTRSDAR